MLKTIAIVVVVLVAAVLAYAATRPDDFRVERRITIQAPPAKVFAFVDDFQRWQAWSPWERLDPSMQRRFSGPASGVGAGYAWAGNSKVGKGEMRIQQATAPSALSIQLDFIAPFEAHNTADFSFIPQGDATEVVWAMHGPAPFVSKLMGVFVSMDRMIGKDFEAGLANLKAAAER